VTTIHNLKKISEGDRVVIRAHGEPQEIYNRLNKLGAKIIDTTCFWVKKVQQEAIELEKSGYQVIICGEKEHPEVKATIGHIERGVVISAPEEAERLDFKGKVALLSQTTFSAEIFRKIQKILKRKKGIILKVLGTICNFTQAAQREARELGKRVDLLIVVGGKHSSNTKRLKETGEKICPTYHVETAEELKREWFKDKRRAGLLAGASTPDWIINQVEQRLEEL
jgi:4-hydroxy-3-methylbut-2-enyl diphosphate reductase